VNLLENQNYGLHGEIDNIITVDEKARF